MFFELENIGAIKHAEIELGKLTVIYGQNNTGKTYMTYSLYGFLSHLREKPFSRFLRAASSYFRPIFKSIDKGKLYAELKEQGVIRIDLKEAEPDLSRVMTLLSQLYTEKLKDIFSASSNDFAMAKFHTENTPDIVIDYSEPFLVGTSQYEAVKPENSCVVEIKLLSMTHSSWLIDFLVDDILFEFFLRKDFPNPFILSEERTGIQLFQREFQRKKGDFATTLKGNRRALLEENQPHFSLPVEKNVDFATRSELVAKSTSFLAKEKPKLIGYIEDMLGVRYKTLDGQKVVIDKITKQILPYYMSSTSVRALFDLHLWLKHQAEKGDILFLDEPELHLHPENQLKMARLLVRLIHSGLNVFITTRSDYLIKELSNLLMLANDFQKKAALMKDLGYTPDDVLLAEEFRGYIAHTDGTTSPIETDEYGRMLSGFDDAIVRANEVSNQLISAIDNNKCSIKS